MSFKFRLLFPIFFLFLSLYPFSLTASPPFILVDVEKNTVLDSQNAFARWYPASLTKLMTAYIVFKELDRGTITTETPVIISPIASKMQPVHSGYRTGSILRLDDALKIMIVRSANDIAVAISETLNGKEEDFVQEMNRQAARLGMNRTNFSNASGLFDRNNYSTVRDMAILAVQLRREFPQYAHYFEIPALQYAEKKQIQKNSNYLIGRYEGADGMKTGFICASGFNLVASATRKGRTLIAIVFGASHIDHRESLAAQLLTKGFQTEDIYAVTLDEFYPDDRTDLTQITDLRKEICNEEAWKLRAQGQDPKGNIIFSSPYMQTYNNAIVPQAINLLFEPANIIETKKNVTKATIFYSHPPIPLPHPFL